MTRLKPFLIAIMCALLAVACVPPRPGESPERATARSVVLTVAHAVKAADESCARVETWPLPKAKRLDILTACAKAFDASKAALFGAEAGLDAWKAGDEGKLACVVAKALEALLAMQRTVRSAGVSMPAAVEDGIGIANGFLAVAGKLVCK